MSVVTTTVTINTAFLEEIKEDDRQLRHLLSEARATFTQRRFHRAWLIRTVALLSDLRDQLALHFTLEESFGYFDEPICAAPWLSERAEALRSQHRDLFIQMCEIVDRAERSLEPHARRTRLDRVSDRFDEFLAALEQHEADETDLIFQAYNDDIGVGD
ncbi:MAG: hypothetical protein IIA67_11150 [Planctomycetes bacterium]|nr:hypothetical protein [Planctomycetota bacterium]